METILRAVGVFLPTILVHGGSFVVVPNDLANKEGDGSAISVFFIEYANLSSARYQQIYDASQFAAVDSGGGYITTIFFRADSSVVGVSDTIGSIQINFSTTRKSPSNLSP